MKSTHLIKEIYELSQLRSPEADQISFLFVMVDQGTEVSQEIKVGRV